MHNKTKKKKKKRSESTAAQQQHRDLLPPHQHTKKPWGTTLATKNKSLSRSSEEYNFKRIPFFSPCTPLTFCPNPLLWDLHPACHKPYSLMSKNTSVSQHHSLLAFNFPRNASAISRLSPYMPKANTQSTSV
ncbi:hypothetical protein PO909_032133 [Leuciscus waleckii]